MPEGSQNTGHAILDGLYELHDTVGTGGFAKVKVATHIQTGLKVGELLTFKSRGSDYCYYLLQNFECRFNLPIKKPSNIDTFEPGCNQNHG